MRKPLITLLSLLSLTVLSGCFGVTDTTDSINDSTENKDTTIVDSSIINELSVEAIINPDSTVQIYLPEFPFMYSWEVKKDGVVMDTLWNQLWIDSTSGTENTSYEVTLRNSLGESIVEETFSPKHNSDEPEVGLIYPNSKTKQIIGDSQLILWNPESFPTDSLRIKASHMSKRKNSSASAHSTREIVVANTGMTMFSMNTGNYYNQINLNSDTHENYVIYRIYPSNTHSESAYTYESDSLRIYVPSYSKTITYPVLGDSTEVGRLSALTWNKTEISSSKITIRLLNNVKQSVANIYDVENSGEHVWPIPNVDEGLYHIKLDYKDENDNLRTKIGFPFYIKK